MIWNGNEDIAVVRCAAKRRAVQRALDAHRGERRPYLFLTGAMQPADPLQRILVPVTMLEEEVYKAEICAYLARKTGAALVLLRANDYGSRALRNTQRILTHVQAVAARTETVIPCEELVGRKDSFGLYAEAARRNDLGCGLLVLTASREYGLDDWLFGAPEQHAILRSTVPVMLVNPRADLFSLCD